MARQSQSSDDSRVLRLGLPKGSMQQGVFSLLEEAGVRIKVGLRGYRPTLSLPGFEAKILKPQNIVEMLHAGSRDIGFAGADWVAELEVADLVELIDTGLDPVRLVAAAPAESVRRRGSARAPPCGGLRIPAPDRAGSADGGSTPPGAILWRHRGLPPRGRRLHRRQHRHRRDAAHNGLVIIDELMRSSTRLYANPGRTGRSRATRVRSIASCCCCARCSKPAAG